MKKEKTVKFTTKRMKLESMTDAEIEALIENTADEESKKAYGEMLEGCKKDPKNRLWYTPWKMILKKEKDAVIGDLSFKGPANEYGMVEIGYGVKPEYEGRGYMTEAVKAMTDYAFQSDRVFFVEAETDPDNEASKKVLTKNGFVQEGSGKEGPRFCLAKPEMSMISLGISIGMCIGVALGCSMDNLSLGIAMGMCVGVALGAGLDKDAKKKRAAAVDLRNKYLTEKKENDNM